MAEHAGAGEAAQSQAAIAGAVAHAKISIAWKSGMKRSSSKKILTTHVGSLPRPDGTDRAGNEDEAALRQMVAGVVARQREIGIDVVNEGEYAKGGDWLSYVDSRFGGFEARPPEGGTPVIMQGKDREEFADFYRYATQRGTLFYEPAGQIKQARPHWVATAPVTYRGARFAQARDRAVPFGGVAGHRGLHHQHGAGEPRALSPQRILQDPGRVRLRHRRGDAHRIPDHHRCGLRAAGRRRLAAGAVGPHRHADGARSVPQILRGADRGAEPRCAACPRIASAITCAGAAGTARTPSTSSR